MTRASPEDLARLLASVGVFGALSEEEILWLARRVPEMRLGRGQILFGPTQESRIVFVVLEGRVRLYAVETSQTEILAYGLPASAESG